VGTGPALAEEKRPTAETQLCETVAAAAAAIAVETIGAA